MKSAFASKTVWFNLLSLVAMLFALPEVTGLLSPDQMRYVAAFVAGSNIVLRFLTVEPVSVTKPKE